MAGHITYTPSGRTAFSCRLVTGSGAVLTVSGAVDATNPLIEGAEHLRSNAALVSSLWAHAMHEAQYRRLRAPEKRESHAKQSQKHRALALSIAGVVERLGGSSRPGWCSACFANTTHRQVLGYVGAVPMYLCEACGAPTTPCAAVTCPHMANRRTGASSLPRYCAEHRHDIPAFTRLNANLDSIDEYADWLSFDKKNLAKLTKIAVVTVGVGAALTPAALALAPAIGGMTGVLTGLSGAAATSHGLALWGGGTLAAGGLGMAGGTTVITVVGGSLGGVLGGVTTSAYVRTDTSFRIEKLRDGRGAPVLLASGFLTEGNSGWGDWQNLVDARYPDHTVYRVHWGAKELKALGFGLGEGAAKQAGRILLRKLASSASKRAAGATPLGPLLFASDLAKNAWSVARHRAAMTGAVLADLIARTDGPPFILVGHSLGARVMVTAAQTLGTRHASPRLETVHLLGAAVGANGDWRTLNDAVNDRVWNYRSQNDNVLKYLYRTAQVGQMAVGVAGFRSSFPKISDVDVSRTVASHSGHFSSVVLR